MCMKIECSFKNIFTSLWLANKRLQICTIAFTFENWLNWTVMSLKAKVMLLAFALAFILQQIQGYDVLMVVGGMYVNQSVAYTVKAVEVIGLTSVCQVHLFAMYYITNHFLALELPKICELRSSLFLRSFIYLFIFAWFFHKMFVYFQTVENSGFVFQIDHLPEQRHSLFGGRLSDRAIVCGGNDGTWERAEWFGFCV